MTDEMFTMPGSMSTVPSAAPIQDAELTEPASHEVVFGCAQGTVIQQTAHAEIPGAATDQDAPFDALHAGSSVDDLVRAYLDRENIEILFDDSIRRSTALTAPTCEGEIDAFLAQEEIDGSWLLDELSVNLRAGEIKHAKSDIACALRRIIRVGRRARRNAVVRPLLAEPTADEQARAAQAWRHLTEAVFEDDATLAMASLMQFMWQVKQKLLARRVKHHLMPVVWSPIQGSGKTTFVLKLLAALRELAAGPVLLSDFADARSGDIYRYPALLVDDMERIERSLIPNLKQLVTADGVRRRAMGTSNSRGYRQLATLIGTANEAVDTLVADATGNRRFVSLRFRNGRVADGDPSVWNAVEAMDPILLWRSVPTFGPPPIEAHLEALATHQRAGQPVEPVLEWLRGLDLDAPELAAVLIRGGARACGLYELFCRQTDAQVTQSEFGKLMSRYTLDPTVPFRPKVKKTKNNVYPLRLPTPKNA